ncbi:MAG: sulfatase-like hydrolase/transferase [Candidatus Neomarinimicrobiota bacterium]
MKKRLIYTALTALFWMTFFLVTRVLFFLFNFYETAGLSPVDLLAVQWHGMKMDLSVTAYLLVLPFLFLIGTSFTRKPVFYVFSKIYTVVMLILTILIAGIDARLYRYWGFRLDITPLIYLETPKEAFASVTFGDFFLPILVGIVLFVLFWILNKRVIVPVIKKFRPDYLLSPVSFLILTVLLVIPMRGGLGIAPLNVGSVYFHENMFANHAAINVNWNAIYSLTKKDRLTKQYRYMPTAQADSLFTELQAKPGKPVSLLKSSMPNIILILMESFTAKIIEPLGGKSGITPNFNRLVSEGILFTNFFANGDRSDKGIVCVLSGYPAQPQNSIVKYANKTQKLPNLIRDLKDDGYATAFYYGGEIDFANLNSYFVLSGVDRLITMDDFDASTFNAKWGVHDHIMFDRFADDLDGMNQPFFSTLFTLSSHEPFDVPMQPVFIGDDSETKYLNSAYYADSCLGEFIARAKKTKWWNNTLIVITADHGIRHPGKSPNHSIEKFKVPMLWIGGALKKTGLRIDSYASQIDIPATLAAQIGLSSADYRFSKDILNPKNRDFAFYTFNNGFGFITDLAKVVYGNDKKHAIFKSGTQVDRATEYGKAYMQTLSDDFFKK